MQENKPEAKLELKPKTINYLNSSANSTEKLLAQAIEYRRLFDSSKTSLAREIYAKKLKKIVNKLDPYMKMFASLQDAKNTISEDSNTVSENTE